MQRCVVFVYYLVANRLNLVKLIRQELGDIGCLLGRLKRDAAHQSMPTLVGFSKRVSQAYNALIELLQGFMLGVTARVQVNGMGYIPRQEQQTYKISGVHCGMAPISGGGIAPMSDGGASPMSGGGGAAPVSGGICISF